MEAFSHLIGNEKIKSYLKNMIAKRAVANSLLFAGIDGIGKSCFAEAFATHLFAVEAPQTPQPTDLANHPDIHHYRPEGKSGMHSMETIRLFCDEVYLAPYAAPRKVCIIHDAHRMHTYSANALLKTYEEPPPSSVIILLSSRADALLPTVVSRCRTFRFQPIADSEIATYLIAQKRCTTEEARTLAAAARGSLTRALDLFATGGDDPAAEQLQKLLQSSATLPYHQLVEAVQSLCEQVEKQVETAHIKEELLHGCVLDDLSAYQRQLLEKKVDGAVTVALAASAYRLFDQILCWYRDLHLLYLGGAHSQLFHSNCSLPEREPPALMTVYDAVAEARLSLERATALNIVIENLLLKLSLLW